MKSDDAATAGDGEEVPSVQAIDQADICDHATERMKADYNTLELPAPISELATNPADGGSTTVAKWKRSEKEVAPEDRCTPKIRGPSRYSAPAAHWRQKSDKQDELNTIRSSWRDSP